MNHYNKDYFNWQKEIGKISGITNQFLYKGYIKPTDNVIDFGCGGGYILANVECAAKRGVEINPEARNTAKELGIDTVQYTSEIPDNWADVIISTHALEHTHNPLAELELLYKKLKPGGKIIITVPSEKKTRYKPNDINQHLYTWTEMNLANLMKLAGFKVIHAKEILHRFPPKPVQLYRMFGRKNFHLLSQLTGLIRRDYTQVQVAAYK